MNARSPSDLISSFPWASLTGDPADVRALRESLVASVASGAADLEREVAWSEAARAARYVAEHEGNATHVALLLLELAECTGIPEPDRVVDEVAWLAAEHAGVKALLSERTDALSRLWETPARSSVARCVGVAKLGTFEARVRDALASIPLQHPEHDFRRREDDARSFCVLAAALVALDASDLGDVGIRSMDADTAVARNMAAACLRLAAARDASFAGSLSSDQVSFADENGHPGMIAKAYRDAAPIPMPEELSVDAPLTTAGAYEHAQVLFASASLTVAAHPTRGNFTLRITNPGLTKGDAVEVAGFVPGPTPRIRSLRYRVEGEWRELSLS